MLQARRNLLSELLDAAARLPLWASLVLAFVAFVMLHPFAIMEVSAAGPVDDYAALTSKAFWKGLAGTVQYVVPAVFLVAPLVATLLNRIIKRRDS